MGTRTKVTDACAPPLAAPSPPVRYRQGKLFLQFRRPPCMNRCSEHHLLYDRITATSRTVASPAGDVKPLFSSGRGPSAARTCPAPPRFFGASRRRLGQQGKQPPAGRGSGCKGRTRSGAYRMPRPGRQRRRGAAPGESPIHGGSTSHRRRLPARGPAGRPAPPSPRPQYNEAKTTQRTTPSV